MLCLWFFICKRYPPRIIVAKSTPATSRKDAGPACEPQRVCESPKAPPKSISFTSETGYQKELPSRAQVNFVNINFNALAIWSVLPFSDIEKLSTIVWNTWFFFSDYFEGFHELHSAPGRHIFVYFFFVILYLLSHKTCIFIIFNSC